MRAIAAEHQDHVPEPNVTRLLFADTRMAPVWLIVRLWLGYEWLGAALGKWVEGGWVGVVLVLAWRVAGLWGLDRWILPAIGVPGAAGTLFRNRGKSASTQ